MQISTMRRVDRWLGVPMCAGLTVLRRLRDIVRGPGDRPVERILFIKLAEQGSTVLACSALRRAAEMVGRENVYFLAFEENAFILDVMDIVNPDNVLTIRAEGLIGTMTGALGAVRRMRRLRIDATIDLEFFARSSAALSLLSGARRRVGFHAYGGEGPYRGNLMTHRLRINPHLHTSQTFRLMVEALEQDPAQLPTFGLVPPNVDDAPPSFAPGPDEVSAARKLVAEAAGADRFEPLVLLNANCSDILPLRAWPRERYVDLARRLLERFPDVRIAMTGAPAEAEPVRALVAEVGSERCFCLAGRTTLRELLVIYTMAELLVTNDSGPAHFATLTPIEVITLFGPEHPALFAARSPRNHVVFAGLACSPCVSALNNRTSSCRDNLCMQRIEVETVFDRACRLLESRTGDTAATGEPPVPTVEIQRR
jgi:ADP-heptose:LPS heptosyltransferase